MTLSERIYYSADRRMKEATLNLIEPDENAVLLDFGPGDCQFTTEIKRKSGGQVLVVDCVPARLHSAESFGFYGYFADLNHSLPIEPGFDAIHAGQVIEHLSNTDILIKEIKRLLKPGGYCIISTNNLASWHNVGALVMGKQPGAAMVSDEIPVSDEPADKDMPKHRRIFTPDGLVRLLKYHGLKVESVKGAGYYPFGWFQGVMAWLDPQHAAYVVVKARKL